MLGTHLIARSAHYLHFLQFLSFKIIFIVPSLYCKLQDSKYEYILFFISLLSYLLLFSNLQFGETDTDIEFLGLKLQVSSHRPPFYLKSIIRSVVQDFSWRGWINVTACFTDRVVFLRTHKLANSIRLIKSKYWPHKLFLTLLAAERHQFVWFPVGASCVFISAPRSAINNTLHCGCFSFFSGPHGELLPQQQILLWCN